MKRTHFAVLFSILLLSLNCSRPIHGIEGSISEGVFYHDVVLTNNSARDLHECHLEITTIGETGEPASAPRYFAVWANGQKQTVSLSIEKSPKNVQKVSVEGTCKEGGVHLSWIPKKK